MNEIIGWHIALVFFAAFIGWKDRNPTFLRKLYVWWHNVTTSPSKNIDMESSKQKGFVFGQSIKGKLTNAIPFAILFEIATLLVPDTMPLYVELMFFVTGTFTIFVGFMLTPLLAGAVGLGSWSINTVDKVEKGEIDLRETFTDTLEQAKDALGNVIPESDKPQESRPPQAFKPPPEEIKEPEGPSNEELIEKMKNFRKDK